MCSGGFWWIPASADQWLWQNYIVSDGECENPCSLLCSATWKCYQGTISHLWNYCCWNSSSTSFLVSRWCEARGMWKVSHGICRQWSSLSDNFQYRLQWHFMPIFLQSCQYHWWSASRCKTTASRFVVC